MSKIKFILIAILIFALGSTFALWTPDSDYQQMRAKYLDSRSQFITLDNNLRVHVRDTGGDSRQVILMIHGTSDSLLTWDVITPFLMNDFRLISLDLPGHGFSSSNETASYSNFVASVTGVLDYFDIESATLMGNSLGGGIAWRTALLEKSYVENLILLNPSGAPRLEKPKSNLGFRMLGNPVGRFFGRNITPRPLIERSLVGTVVDPQLVNDELVDRYWHLLRLPGNRQALSELATMPRSDKAWRQIGEINSPTFIVWGAEDALIPASHGERFATAMQNAQLKIYKDIGHLPMIEAPNRLAKDITAFMQLANSDYKQ